jgi:hypothetical protein
MTLRFVASKDSYVWTDIGLSKIEELSLEHRILGLDGKGAPQYQKIILKPQSLKKEKLIRLITDCNEAFVWEKQKVIKLGGSVTARSLICDEDKLELCINPKYYNEVFNVLMNRPYQTTPEISFLLGGTKKIRSEKKNEHTLYFYSNNWDDIENLAKICWDALFYIDINPLDKIRRGFSRNKKYTYEIKINSKKFIDYLNLIEPDHNRISNEIRTSSFDCFCNYLLGIIQSYSNYENYNYIMKTKINESEIRRLIYNVLPLFSNKPNRTFFKSKMINITIPQDVVHRINERNITTTIYIPHFHLIKKIDQFRLRQVLGFETTGTNWSPVVDLLLLESSY